MRASCTAMAAVSGTPENAWRDALALVVERDRQLMNFLTLPFPRDSKRRPRPFLCPGSQQFLHVSDSTWYGHAGENAGSKAHRRGVLHSGGSYCGKGGSLRAWRRHCGRRDWRHGLAVRASSTLPYPKPFQVQHKACLADTSLKKRTSANSSGLPVNKQWCTISGIREWTRRIVVHVDGLKHCTPHSACDHWEARLRPRLLLCQCYLMYEDPGIDA